MDNGLNIRGRMRGRLTLHSHCCLAGSRPMRVGGHSTVLGGITHSAPTRPDSMET